MRYVPTTTGKEQSGPAALKAAADDAVIIIRQKKPLDRELTPVEYGNIYAEHIHKPSEDGLGPYFRLIYTILKRIDSDKELTPEEKVQYGNLLRGQLGSPEVALISLNGLTKASKDLSMYLRRYRVPKYIAISSIRAKIPEWYGADVLEDRPD